MEWGPASTRLSFAPLEVEFRQAQPGEARREAPFVCVMGIGPSAGPWVSDRVPETAVRTSRFDGHPIGGEQLRLASRDAANVLPGLSDRIPSLLRDTVGLMLGAGASAVDVVIGRGPECKPWDYLADGVVELIDKYVVDMPGAMLLFPDLGGPSAVVPGAKRDPATFVARAAALVQRYGPHLKERFQTMVLDLPPEVGGPQLRELEAVLLGHDVALCRWAGNAHAMRVHGWRAAAGVVGGVIGADGGAVHHGLAGRRVPLSGGRKVRPDRRSQLVRGDEVLPPVEGESRLMVVEVAPNLETATIVGDPSFRRPLGSWPVTALRVAKAVHRTLRETAAQFVFEAANPAQAVGLAAALQQAMLPFVNVGLLSGPPGMASPAVSGGVDLDPSHPNIFADVAATLRPWSRRLDLKVSLKPNSQPQLEES